jgi:uncharacterized damage-inducible protein DinB
MDTEALILQLRFSAWASRRVLESTAALSAEERHRNLGSSFGSVYDTLEHIYQADAIWWDRLMGVPTGDLSKYDPSPDLSEWLPLLDRYIEWAKGLKVTDWDRIVAFRFVSGDAGQQPVWQIVLHVVNHASYHRGQIATMLRQLGHKPAGTDLIMFYRSLAAAAGT